MVQQGLGRSSVKWWVPFLIQPLCQIPFCHQDCTERGWQVLLVCSAASCDNLCFARCVKREGEKLCFSLKTEASKYENTWKLVRLYVKEADSDTPFSVTDVSESPYPHAFVCARGVTTTEAQGLKFSFVDVALQLFGKIFEESTSFLFFFSLFVEIFFSFLSFFWTFSVSFSDYNSTFYLLPF